MKVTAPLVSIIIPTYNSWKYLPETVRSAVSQNYPHVEIIVIDDGSTDATRELFPEFERQGVICIRQNNAGASSARNNGLGIAKGDYVQFLDADDIMHPDKIKQQVAKMQYEDADLSFTSWGNFREDQHDSDQFRFRHLDFSSITTGMSILHSFGIQNWFIPTLAWLVRRDLIIKAGYWNPFRCPNDDGEYFSRLLFWSKKVSVISEKLAFYRLTPGISLSNTNTEEKALATLRSWKLIHALMQSSGKEMLLSYPKRGFYVGYLMTRKSFPKVSRRFASEFDRIDAPTFLNRHSYYWLIEWLGLYRGNSIIEFSSKVKSYLFAKKK